MYFLYQSIQKLQYTPIILNYTIDVKAIFIYAIIVIVST